MSIDYNALAKAGGLGKGPTREKTKRAARQTQADVIREVREQVFERDKRCLCGACEPVDTDEMHEIVPRSKTRGLHPRRRFNKRNCVRLSRRCHADVTHHVLALEVFDLRGAQSKVLVWRAIIGKLGTCWQCAAQFVQLYSQKASGAEPRCRGCIEGENYNLLIGGASDEDDYS